MNRCEAPNCKMRTYALTEEQLRLVKNNYVISFHKFPDDPDKRRSWINAANRPSWRPPIFNSSLCSLHFRDDCFNENNELYDHAVPSLFFDDFRNHMTEIVEKLDLQYNDDNSKQNSSVESNQSSTQLEADEDVNFVECEEVVIYENNQNVKLGIENISIPEVDESIATTTKNDASELPVTTIPKLDTSKINPNSIVDIKITSADTIASNRGGGNEIKCTDVVKPISSNSATTNATSSVSVPKSTNNFDSVKPKPTYPSPSVTKPSLATTLAESSVQGLSSVSTTSTSSVWDFKSNGVSSKPLQPSIPNSSVAKPTLPPSSIPPVSKPSNVQIPDVSSIVSTTRSSALNNSPTKSAIASSQSSKPVNVTSSVSPITTAKTTSTPSTAAAGKPTTTSNEPVANLATSREKNTSGTYSILEPVTKSLVVQLLNIVKMANTSDMNKPKPGQTYSSYLVTSKCTETDSKEPCEVLPSIVIIENIANYVRMIKNESFVKPKNVSIICGSPAIFLLKNITVEECDPNMNSVYVITTENLLQHLCRMKMKSNPDTSSSQQQFVDKPKTNNLTPNKPLLVADLVSSANPKAVVPIQNRLNSSPAVNNTLKPNTVTRLSNIGEKLANNSISPADVAKPTESKTLPNKSIIRCTTTKPATNSLSTTQPKLPAKNSISSPNVAKPATKSVFFATKPGQSANNCILSSTAVEPAFDPTSPLTAAKPASQAMPCSTVPRLPANNSIPRSTSAKPGTNYSIVYNKDNPALQSSLNRPWPNTYGSSPRSAKLPSVRPVSGPPTSTFKPAQVGIAGSTLPAAKIVNHSNFSKTPSYSQTSTITNPVVKTGSSATPLPNTHVQIPDTPIARVIPSTVGGAVALRPLTPNSPVAKLSVQTKSVNVYQKSQPTLYLSTLNQPTVKRSILPMNPSTTQSRTQIPAPTTSVVISSPLVPSVIRSQQPKPTQISVAKSNSLLSSIQSQPQPSSNPSQPPAYIFQPIQPSNFDTNLKAPEVIMDYDSFSVLKQPNPAIPSQSSLPVSLKRKWGEIDDDDDDDDDEDDEDPFFADCDDEEYNQQYLEHQKKEIKNCEANILKKEREISNLKKKIQALKKRFAAVKNPNDTKTDEQLVEEILSKYLDSDGVQFFIGQMKVSGKTYTQFRWSEDDKLFALGLLYKNPAEYNALFQKYTLPSDKTLNKFVSKVKKAEIQDTRSTSGR